VVYISSFFLYLLRTDLIWISAMYRLFSSWGKALLISLLPWSSSLINAVTHELAFEDFLPQRNKGLLPLGSHKATFMDKTPPFEELIGMDLILSCHRGDAVTRLFKLPQLWPFSAGEYYRLLL